ncbi:phage portal protein, partial [Erysipelatoclostridium ramosum]
VKSDAWVGLEYKFTFNIPANITDEAQVASSLEGIISKETQLKVLSIVDDVQSEIDRLKNEEQDAENDIVAKTMFDKT